MCTILQIHYELRKSCLFINATISWYEQCNLTNASYSYILYICRFECLFLYNISQNLKQKQKQNPLKSAQDPALYMQDTENYGKAFRPVLWSHDTLRLPLQVRELKELILSKFVIFEVCYCICFDKMHYKMLKLTRYENLTSHVAFLINNVLENKYHIC